jgi:hypothetical protein
MGDSAGNGGFRGIGATKQKPIGNKKKKKNNSNEETKNQKFPGDPGGESH